MPPRKPPQADSADGKQQRRRRRRRKGGRTRDKLPPEVRREPGRPSKYTPAVGLQIVQAVRLGAYIETAVAHVGINRDTYLEWMKAAARKPEPAPSRRAPPATVMLPDATGKPTPHPAPRDLWEFSGAVQKAMHEAELRRVARINNAGEAGTWQADAWHLERKHPERWAATHRIRLAVDGEIDALLKKLEARLPAATFRAVVVALQSIAVEQDDGAAGDATTAATDGTGGTE